MSEPTKQDYKRVEQAIMKIENFANINPNFISFLFIVLADIEEAQYPNEYLLSNRDRFDIDSYDGGDYLELTHVKAKGEDAWNQELSKIRNGHGSSWCKEEDIAYHRNNRDFVTCEELYIGEELDLSDGWYDLPDEMRRLLVISVIINQSMYVLNEASSTSIARDNFARESVKSRLQVAREQVYALNNIGEQIGEVALQTGNIAGMIGNLANATNNVARETNQGTYKPHY